VIEFEVVLASGELVRASASENADLWIALRGGLNNFGIVTSFTMKTLKAGPVWGGVTYYMPGTFSQVLRSACDFVDDETDEDTHIMCTVGYGFGHQAVTCIMYHTQGRMNPPSLQRFTTVQPQIEHMNTMRTSTLHEFRDELARFSSNGRRQYWASITIKPDLALMETFQDKWQETLAAIKDAEGFIFSLGFHPLTKALLVNSTKAGGNAMNIPPSDGPLFVVLINPVWAQPQDDDRIFAAVEALVADFRRLAAEKGLLHRYIFTNYAYHKDRVMAGYGQESLARLREVSKKYDPEGLFQKGVPGGFKVSE
jgi:FAD/FMN-containing dehydrogenase